MGRPWGLMTAGVAIIGGGIAYVSAFFGYSAYSEVLPVAAIIVGAWLLLEGAVKQTTPAPGEMESILTVGWGVLILAIGIIGDLNVRGYPLAILLAAFAILLGVLAVLAALRMWERRTPRAEKIKQ